MGGRRTEHVAGLCPVKAEDQRIGEKACGRGIGCDPTRVLQKHADL